MIPADHITFDGDTAWWVPFDDEFGTHVLIDTLHDEDRPCDACGGEGVVDDLDNDGAAVKCEWCIDGRHTFDIQVDRRALPMHDWGYSDFGPFLRVSIVPGMVLPIVALDDYPGDDVACIVDFGDMTDQFRWVRYSPDDDFAHEDGTNITLPPAAAPGMWAVKVKVAS